MTIDVTKILIEGTVYAGISLVMLIGFYLITNRRESATDGHLKAALAASQANFHETLQIAIANTAALTKNTETLEQLVTVIHTGTEVSRASAETVRDLVALLKKGE